MSEVIRLNCRSVPFVEGKTHKSTIHATENEECRNSVQNRTWTKASKFIWFREYGTKLIKKIPLMKGSSLKWEIKKKFNETTI
jgi:hypothetical protein